MKTLACWRCGCVLEKQDPDNFRKYFERDDPRSDGSSGFAKFYQLAKTTPTDKVRPFDQSRFAAIIIIFFCEDARSFCFLIY